MKSIHFKLYLVIIVVSIIFLFIVGCTSSPQMADTVGKEKLVAEPASAVVETSQIEKTSSPVMKDEEKVSVTADVPMVSPQPSIKTFSLVAKQWAFEPSTITVTKGDQVHLTITSKDVTHGFKIKEYGIEEKINPGKKTEIYFVADKVGIFSFFCFIPCGKGHTGMNGQLIVQE